MNAAKRLPAAGATSVLRTDGLSAAVFYGREAVQVALGSCAAVSVPVRTDRRVEAANTAIAATEKHHQLWVEYGTMAAELSRLASRRTDAGCSPLSEGNLVAACESLISFQNRG